MAAPRVDYFWQQPAFSAFLPYIKATAAWDKRAGQHPRFDLKHSTPWTVVRDALAFEARCPACGARMHPFRLRKGDRSVYLAATCEQTFSLRCSRGSAASHAYAVIWALVREQAAEGEQKGLAL